VSTLTEQRQQIRARSAGFVADIISVAGRALRLIPRDPEAVIPPLVIGSFFYVINIGALQDFTEQVPGIDYRAFQLPVAIIIGITGISRGITVVTDIQTGYFDRLSITPIKRLALLLGFMVADFVLVILLAIPILIIGFALGVRFETGVLGLLVFILVIAFWGLVFTGFPYAIALKTGNAGAVNSSFLLFFPFVFLTTVFVPRELMTGWLSTIAGYNPVTYLLEALRSLITEGWDGEALAKGLAAVAGVGSVSISLALFALRGRVSRR
jgi:ABC-2 type transport system permease protein